MVAIAISLRLRPHSHRSLLLQNATSSLYFSSSSSDSSDRNQNQTSPSQSQSQPRSSSSYSSYFSDVKSSLKQTQPPPQKARKPSFLNPNPNTNEDPAQKAAQEEIRRNLSEFRRKSSVEPSQSSALPISFHELYKRKVMAKSDPGSTSENTITRPPDFFNSIRASLKNVPPNPSHSQSQQPEIRGRRLGFEEISRNLKLKPQNLKDDMSSMIPQSIGKNKKGMESDEMKTEFLRSYSYSELGEKLRKLRPEVTGNKSTGFSLAELNDRLRMLRENEDKELKNKSGLAFMDIRESLVKLQEEDKTKKVAAQKVGVLSQLGGTPSFSLSPRRKS